jgi:MFS family permease
MTLGGFVGNIALGFIGRYLGRRHALMASCALMILAIGLMFTPSIGVLYFARTLLGTIY